MLETTKKNFRQNENNFIFKEEVINYDFFFSGKDEYVLFLHGWGGNKNSFTTTENLLKKNFNILAITLPTIEPTKEIWTMWDYVELVRLILSVHDVRNLNIICHSFGFRIACLLRPFVEIKKIVVTGGAGAKKFSICKKIMQNNNKIILGNENLKNFFKNIASEDYKNLSKINRETFKNIVNFDLKNFMNFDCKMLLFWGRKDRETPMWTARKIKRKNDAILIKTNSDHFAYLKVGALFNHSVVEFLK
jgi:pimeloyl-ACP methyl ester carboxylesterase